MVHAARLRYERKLAALSDDPEAGTMAAAFVDRLKPCYEWEGYHDCPEHEARFAREYQAANPNGPFKDYLPLLAAHRWLCAAEAYEYEKRPEDAIRARREFDAAVSIARRSPYHARANRRRRTSRPRTMSSVPTLTNEFASNREPSAG